jgi:hypothetical protein
MACQVVQKVQRRLRVMLHIKQNIKARLLQRWTKQLARQRVTSILVGSWLDRGPTSPRYSFLRKSLFWIWSRQCKMVWPDRFHWALIVPKILPLQVLGWEGASLN